MVVGARFGDANFLQEICSSEHWDLLCHHAADVTNYKSLDFDYHTAIANNTYNIRRVLDELSLRGCHKVVFTGSVFECDEGAGNDDRPAFSPYGLSKALTFQIFRYHTVAAGMRLGKFVIANPFGPYEEPRFTSYLVRTWYGGGIPSVNTPLYVRDNIHISLLAQEYLRFCSELESKPGLERLNPTGYVSSQGSFALQFAQALRPRLGLPCELTLATQTDFSEPRMRINTDYPDIEALGWDEERAWDDLADYYKQIYGRQ